MLTVKLMFKNVILKNHWDTKDNYITILTIIATIMPYMYNLGHIGYAKIRSTKN